HDPKIAAQAKRVIEIKDGEILSDTKKEKAQEKLTLKTMSKERKNTYFGLKIKPLSVLKIAYSSILAHKLRSVLTMLGIIIGIAS
ncbi:macrolide ABC transporter permease/ATP-binding protein MacB, partial [Campylobacter jejuni]|nr:macrolide ABC transporter permease/ATP-binding protein MacB [Campylobacter jejuni]